MISPPHMSLSLSKDKGYECVRDGWVGSVWRVGSCMCERVIKITEKLLRKIEKTSRVRERRCGEVGGGGGGGGVG